MHSWALQVFNTNSLKALLNTGVLKTSFNSNTCLYSLLNQNQIPVYRRSLNFTISNYALRMMSVCHFQQQQPKLTKLSRATNKKRNKARSLSVLESWQSTKEEAAKKSFFFPAFSSLGSIAGCVLLHSNQIISFSEMISPRKRLLIVRLLIGCSTAHPPPSTWGEHLE